jgi:hypothetical protein
MHVFVALSLSLSFSFFLSLSLDMLPQLDFSLAYLRMFHWEGLFLEWMFGYMHPRIGSYVSIALDATVY